MKTKIVLLSLFVTGFIAACGVTDSTETEKEFNPHIDGLWGTQAVISITCDDDPSKICDQYHDIYYVSIEYPQIYACYERTSTSDDVYIKATKEDVEVAHTNEDLYSIKTVNGDPVASDTVAIKMNIDEDGDLGILKKVPGGELDGLYYNSDLASLDRYPTCRKNATYTKDALHFNYEDFSF